MFCSKRVSLRSERWNWMMGSWSKFHGSMLLAASRLLGCLYVSMSHILVWFNMIHSIMVGSQAHQNVLRELMLVLLQDCFEFLQRPSLTLPTLLVCFTFSCHYLRTHLYYIYYIIICIYVYDMYVYNIYICYHILTLPLKRQHTVYGIVNYLLLTHPGAVCCVGPNHSASHPYLCLPRAHWRLLPWRRSLVPHTAALQSVKHEKTIKNVQLSYGQGIRQSVFRGRIHKNIWQVAEGTEQKLK